MTNTDKPKTYAERVKFKLEFMSLMLMTGREDEAVTALKEAHELLDEIIASEADLGLNEDEEWSGGHQDA